MIVINDYLELHNTAECLVVFDLETTGLSAANDRIIEIGAFKIKDGTIIDKLSILVNPHVPVPYYATKVNGITTDMLVGAISDIEGVNKFVTFAKNSIIIAHNVNFDTGFINAYLNRLNRPQLKNRVVDTVKLARKAFPGRKKYSLGIVAGDLGIDVLNAHRAEDDARVCYELYVKCIDQLFGDMK
ncbi:MAG: hypothetical protein B6229_10145 [Spirochaetaceae bacterium 4572_7]|nr:MAG: hypothetical protein B6229_10145 [Spirochaetaceae bacterium 4572_7]